MKHSGADKTPRGVILAAMLALTLAGCGGQTTTNSDPLNNSGTSAAMSSGRADNRTGASALDFGDDWDRPAQATDARRARTDQPSRSRLAAPAQSAEPGDAGPTWSIILGTYTGPDHLASARRMLGELPRVSPMLADARVQRQDNGSMVVYGRYGGPDDARAQRDLREIKSIRINDLPVFPRAFLSRVAGAAETSSPYALMNVRQLYPDTDPLYTLQVAVWGDFGSGQFSDAEIRRRAEAYARELRAQGHDAYVHHSNTQRMSLVTVGLFDHRAFDAKSGVDSPELRRLKEQFPIHQVNGEELREPIDPRRPAAGTRVQTPRLVKVPMP